MADEHRVVFISILSTLVAAVIIFAVSVALSGGIAIDFVRGYVLPLIISPFTLSVFWCVLYVTSRTKASKASPT
ncbi:MAG TPA: hypothetical protein VIW22_02845 [Nitrososphaerales archaeon]